MDKNWSVYLLECADKTFYTGITNNIEKRLIAHNQGKTGAKYTKGRRPVRLVYKETDLNKSDALKREDVLRKQPRSVKLDLIKKIDK